jgi:hypothetical protein
MPKCYGACSTPRVSNSSRGQIWNEKYVLFSAYLNIFCPSMIKIYNFVCLKESRAPHKHLLRAACLRPLLFTKHCQDQHNSIWPKDACRLMMKFASDVAFTNWKKKSPQHFQKLRNDILNLKEIIPSINFVLSF